MRVYKVVSETPYRRYNWNNWDNPEEFFSVAPAVGGTLVYSVGKWTRAVPGSVGIFCFTSLQMARDFARWSDRVTFVAECKGKPRRIRNRLDPGASLRICLSFLRGVRSLKERIVKLARRTGVIPAPAGSHVVSSLRLIKRV